MHRDNCLGIFCYSRFNKLSVKVSGFLFNVNKNRVCSCMQYGACSSAKTHGCGNNLVTRANAECDKTKMEGGCATGNAYGVMQVEITGKVVLKFPYLFAGCEKY